MKKVMCLILAAILCVFGMAGCGSAGSNVDIDITSMSETVAYSFVYQVLANPTAFVGQTFRVSGPYSESYYDVTDVTYHYVVIADSTACCSQGIEFICKDDGVAFPASGSNIEITGTFGSYEELGETYYCIEADSITVQ